MATWKISVLVCAPTGVTGTAPSHAIVILNPFPRRGVECAPIVTSTIKLRAVPFARTTSAGPSMSAMPMASFGVVASVDRVVKSILNARVIRILTCALAENSSRLSRLALLRKRFALKTHDNSSRKYISFRSVATTAVERLAYHSREKFTMYFMIDYKMGYAFKKVRNY
mmetsp:Transcript_28574/g.46368  ORF Transcript_28574/g.46368 Transcript_28574/m.46368 type:complete len:169 (-) Transcript_28574:36-542(-)